MKRMYHPNHGYHHAYNDVEEADMRKNGWVDEPTVKKAAEKSEEVDSPEKAYEKKFGKPPHWKMSLDTIIEKLKE